MKILKGNIQKQFGLTKQQAEAWMTIYKFARKNGFMPSLTDLAHDLGLTSPHTAREQLVALERKGALSLNPFTARAIVLHGIPTFAQMVDNYPDPKWISTPESRMRHSAGC